MPRQCPIRISRLRTHIFKTCYVIPVCSLDWETPHQRMKSKKRLTGNHALVKLGADMLLNCGVGEDSWESFGLQGNQTSQSYRKSILDIHWKDWPWSWSSNALATWQEELTHWKRPWCWERLKAGEEGDDRGWDDWMASPTRWTWVWAGSRSWWWTKPGVTTPHGVAKSWTRLSNRTGWAPCEGQLSVPGYTLSEEYHLAV